MTYPPHIRSIVKGKMLIFGLPAMLLAPLTLRLYRSALGRLTRED